MTGRQGKKHPRDPERESDICPDSITGRLPPAGPSPLTRYPDSYLATSRHSFLTPTHVLPTPQKATPAGRARLRRLSGLKGPPYRPYPIP